LVKIRNITSNSEKLAYEHVLNISKTLLRVVQNAVQFVGKINEKTNPVRTREDKEATICFSICSHCKF
jgi:hypothetical protein